MLPEDITDPTDPHEFVLCTGTHLFPAMVALEHCAVCHCERDHPNHTAPEDDAA